jgi:single stranded DNA-binding protein
MNLGIFSGYLGRDAEIKPGPSGDNVANFSVACNTGTKEKPSTLWVDCALWGKRADSLAQYLLKGTAITVSGKVNCRHWIGKDGQAASAITCRIEDLTFGGKSAGNAPDSPADAPSPTAAPETAKNTVGALHEKMAAMDQEEGKPDFNDDIPF